MKRNSRLSLALHTVGHMAAEPDRPQTSAEIAAHAGTNPVVVRRVLGKLREAGLLTSEKGHAGGWKLAREPKKITLADVYLALDERLIASDNENDVHQCSVANALHNQISEVMEDIEKDLVQRLSSTTIADVHKARHQH